MVAAKERNELNSSRKTEKGLEKVEDEGERNGKRSGVGLKST